ncbi:helix-turn-helix domain-containing protein [Catenulispora subtropica]|uniref:Helix-turn-helix domain-containing protein n=1 Tax=Catenulispora subtropica TaxID=450798 RepID=A0ABP5BSX6_9ACTN
MLSTPQAVRGEVISTSAVPEHESLDYWCDAVMATLVGMDVDTAQGTIDGEIRIDRLGDLQISTVATEAGEVHRAPRFIARGDGGRIFVAVQSKGTAQVEQDGRTTELRPGDMAFFENTRPYRTRFPERFVLKIFSVPRALLGRSEGELRHLTARAVRPTHGVAALVSPFMEHLADASTSYDAPVAARLAQSMTSLLAATAADQLGIGADDLPGAERVLLFRIKSFIRWHLSDPDLSPQKIASAHGISLRYLHKLFADDDEGMSVGRWIREQRLRECRSELAAGSGTATLGQVARRWGFSGSAHFGRVFRSVYGVSPSEWLHELNEPIAIGRAA